MRKFDLSLRSSRSSYFATFRHQLTILSKTDALDEEKWLNMLGTFVKDWFRYESHFVHGRDSLGHIKFNLTIPLQQLNGLETLVIIMVANKYAFLQITRRRFLNEWEAFKKVIS